MLKISKNKIFDRKEEKQNEPNTNSGVKSFFNNPYQDEFKEKKFPQNIFNNKTDKSEYNHKTPEIKIKKPSEIKNILRVNSMTTDHYQNTKISVHQISPDHNIANNPKIYSKISKRQAFFPEANILESKYTNNDEIIDSSKKDIQTDRIVPVKVNESSYKNNDIEIFLKSISPKQRETLFKIMKVNNDSPIEDSIINSNINKIMAENTKETSYYNELDLRSEVLKEKMKNMSKILNHMIERRDRIIKEHNMVETILKFQQKELKLIHKVNKRKVFEKDVRTHLESFKLKIEEMHELFIEARDLRLVFNIGGIQNTEEEKEEELYNFIIDKKDFDFISYAMDLYSKMQNLIKNLDLGMRNYKQFLKLDQESQEFHKRTQILLALLNEVTDFVHKSEAKVRALNKELSNDLQELVIFIKDSYENYVQIYQCVEESFDLVDKLIYLRIYKLDEISKELNYFQIGLEDILYPFGTQNNRLNNEKVLKELIEKIEEISSKMKKIEKEIKKKRDDANSQFFLSLRFKESIKNLEKMSEMKKKCSNLKFCIEFLKKSLEGEDKINFQITQDSKKIINEFNFLIDQDLDNVPLLKKLYVKSNLIIIAIQQRKLALFKRFDLKEFTYIEKFFRKNYNHIENERKKLMEIQKRVLPLLNQSDSKNNILTVNKFHENLKNLLNEFEDEKQIGKFSQNEELFYDYENSQENLKEIKNFYKKVKKFQNGLKLINSKNFSGKLQQDLNELSEKNKTIEINCEFLQYIFKDCMNKLQSVKTIEFDNSQWYIIFEETFQEVIDNIEMKLNQIGLQNAFKIPGNEIIKLIKILQEIFKPIIKYHKKFLALNKKIENEDELEELKKNFISSIYSISIKFKKLSNLYIICIEELFERIRNPNFSKNPLHSSVNKSTSNELQYLKKYFGEGNINIENLTKLFALSKNTFLRNEIVEILLLINKIFETEDFFQNFFNWDVISEDNEKKLREVFNTFCKIYENSKKYNAKVEEYYNFLKTIFSYYKLIRDFTEIKEISTKTYQNTIELCHIDFFEELLERDFLNFRNNLGKCKKKAKLDIQSMKNKKVIEKLDKYIAIIDKNIEKEMGNYDDFTKSFEFISNLCGNCLNFDKIFQKKISEFKEIIENAKKNMKTLNYENFTGNLYKSIKDILEFFNYFDENNLIIELSINYENSIFEKDFAQISFLFFRKIKKLNKVKGFNDKCEIWKNVIKLLGEMNSSKFFDQEEVESLNKLSTQDNQKTIDEFLALYENKFKK